jgi:hypothetical protein
MFADGNHESLSQIFLSRFALPQELSEGESGQGEEWYSFDYGNAHFVVLNDSVSSTTVLTGSEPTWLRADLGKVDRQKTPWIFVMHHQGAYSCASNHGSNLAVRAALHGLQLACRRAPGLVADGRDMGTVVFPGATLKVFLTASAEKRAERRHKQLISKGISTNIADLRADLEARDERDRKRAVAPLKPAADALLLDNSALDIDESVACVLGWWQERSPFELARRRLA